MFGEAGSVAPHCRAQQDRLRACGSSVADYRTETPQEPRMSASNSSLTARASRSPIAISACTKRGSNNR
jgi:hypothetical protein